MSDLFCLACMYVQPRPDLDPDALAETEILTVVNGQMVCLRHVPCASPTYHDTLASAIHLESRGEIEGLSAYQEWHRRQRPAQDAAGGE